MWFVTNGDILMRFPYEISCFLGRYAISLCFFCVLLDNFLANFNRDLNQWDVAKVTTMYRSKSIRIVENAIL